MRSCEEGAMCKVARIYMLNSKQSFIVAFQFYRIVKLICFVHMVQGHHGHPGTVRSRVSRVNMDIQGPIVRPSKQENVAVQTVVALVHMMQLLVVLAIVLSP